MEISKKAAKAIDRWAADGYYMWIRPSSSTWTWPGKPHRLYWVVSVEFRNAYWVHWEGRGGDLNEVLLELADLIPRRKKLDPGFIAADEDHPLGTRRKTGRKFKQVELFVRQQNKDNEQKQQVRKK